jgi:SAM-dependent methyltransferase
MILTDVMNRRPLPTIVDIGCGGGLDGDEPLQRSFANGAGRFIGIEPDSEIQLGDYFTETHRSSFEEAPLAAGSVDVAYAVMVLEHLTHPRRFWEKLHEVLANGGVFWGMTVDARHVFSWLSLWVERLGIKNLYLNHVLGWTRHEGAYKNYPTYYRTNTPRQIAGFTPGFRSCECINFSRVGQWSSCLPRPLRNVARYLDRSTIRNERPGTLLIVRASK